MGEAKFVGVDWAKGGWLSIACDADGNWEAHHGSFEEIVKHYNNAKLILVDIPIGIPVGRREGRACDKAARKKISGVRSDFRSSVFRVPSRDALADRMINGLQREEAHHCEKKRTTKPGINRQSWSIIPQIFEVDGVLAKLGKQRKNIREVHPEVCFWALNGKQSLQHKKDQPEGEAERIRILEAGRIEPRTREILDAAWNKYRGQAARDDILDALAAAVTARLGTQAERRGTQARRGLQTLPARADPCRPLESDAHGLPMEMVYYNPHHA